MDLIFARPNSDYNANAGGEPSFDETSCYLVRTSLPGSYDFAYRFSVDGGRNWTYCDGGDAGSMDGYDVDDAGQLDAQPPTAPCETESQAVPLVVRVTVRQRQVLSAKWYLCS